MLSQTVVATYKENPGIHFDSQHGVGYFTTGSALRFGANSASAGLVMKFDEDGHECDITVKGEVVATNSIKAKGKMEWSNGGSEKQIAVAGVTEDDEIHVTTTKPANEVDTEFSHATCGIGVITVHLTNNCVSNSFECNWMVLPGESL